MQQEDFDISSLAAYLHLTPEQVKKMAERGRLPGRRIGGKWKFSPAEIHEWFEKKIGVSDFDDLTQVERVLSAKSTSDQPIKITELLHIDCVFVPLIAKTKVSVIQRMCALTAKTGRLWDPEKMSDAIKGREELHPTALENGVALLHPRRPLGSILSEPFLALGITSSGIPFGGPRGTLTDIFFLIASTDESNHLRVLARLSRLIQHPELLEILRDANDSRLAWQAIADFGDNPSS